MLLREDKYINALADGSPKETVSSHVYRLYQDGKPWGILCPIVDLLFIWQRIPGGHCKDAYNYFIRNGGIPT